MRKYKKHSAELNKAEVELETKSMEYSDDNRPPGKEAFPPPQSVILNHFRNLCKPALQTVEIMFYFLSSPGKKTLPDPNFHGVLCPTEHF